MIAINSYGTATVPIHTEKRNIFDFQLYVLYSTVFSKNEQSCSIIVSGAVIWIKLTFTDLIPIFLYTH